MTMFALALLALTTAFTGDDAKRPYEMVWANRTKDDPTPLVSLTDATGWRVEAVDSVATFTRATDRLLFGDGIVRLTYRATGSRPRIVLRAPQPILLTNAFDTVSCWIYGNNHSYAPDPKTPSVTVAADFRDAAGRSFAVPLLHVHHKEWHKAIARIAKDLLPRAVSGAAFCGFTVTGGTNREDRSLDFNGLCVFKEVLAPLTFAPRAKRPNRVFPEADAGVNTGNGLLPFPNTPLGVTPKTAADARLEVRLPAKASAWDDLAFRWKGGAWQCFAEGGGVWFADPKGAAGRPFRVDESKTTVVTNRVAPLDVTLTGSGVTSRFHMEGKSLVVDVKAAGEVAEVRFGAWRNPPKPQAVPVPYYSYGNWGASGRPNVIAVELAGVPFFLLATLDWTQSNASLPWMEGACWDETVVSNGGVRYLPKTDGRRNACFERFVYSFSDDFDEVLPNIPNPPSPWRHVTGTGVWRSHGAGNRDHDKAYWRGVRARGLKHVIVTDHEVCWRDGNESFTFRTEPAPKKGGDKGMHDYARVMIDELGFVYGPYNNFTDFAPVNANWSPDRVTRYSDLNLVPAWDRCYAPKPAYAVEACAELTPIIQRKFGFNTAYCDVHTAVSPWGRCDFDARVPGGGTFAATFYAFGEIMLIQKRNWQGPVYSEGGMHYLYCGLTDGNYAQDQSYQPAVNPWLVDFDLLRMHPLACNFGMGDVGMFYTRKSAPKDPDVKADRFLAATVAFGHPGYLLGGGAKYEDRSYFMVQGLAARYTQAEAVRIRYLDAEGREHTTSAAVANGVLRRSQVTVAYSDGTFVAANGSQGEAMRLPQGIWLPPNGYCGWSADGAVFVFSGYLDGHRADYSVSPEYVYADGRGVATAFPDGVRTNAAVRLREKDRGVWPSPKVEDFARRSRLPEGLFKPSDEGDFPLPLVRGAGMRVGNGPVVRVDSQTGAYATTGGISCGGVGRTGFVMHPPYKGGAGYVFLRFMLDLPERPLAFSAFVGKGDGSDLGDGIYYRVELTDEAGVVHVLARERVQKHEWRPITADLSAWNGRHVRLALVTDCGPTGNTSGDWGAWGDVKLRMK